MYWLSLGQILVANLFGLRIFEHVLCFFDNRRDTRLLAESQREHTTVTTPVQHSR